MRFSLNPKERVTALVILLFCLSSCQRNFSKLLEDGNPELILVSGVVGSDDLILKDVKGESATHFYVEKGKRVEWLVVSPDVAAITKIHEKPNNKNVFSIRPNRIGNSAHQHGKVKKDIEGGTIEEYYIKWIDKDGKKHVYDPKIQVR